MYPLYQQKILLQLWKDQTDDMKYHIGALFQEMKDEALYSHFLGRWDRIKAT